MSRPMMNLQKKIRLRTFHLRRQKALGKEAMEIKILGVRKLRERIERGNPLWAATQKRICRSS